MKRHALCGSVILITQRTYESVEDIRKFVAAIPKETLVIIDEAYIDFVTSVAVPTARALLDEFPNVAIMRTFSKAYGLANYRVGYMMDTYRIGKLYANHSLAV